MVFIIDVLLLACSLSVSLHIRRALASGRKIAKKNQQDIFRKVYSSDFILISVLMTATFFLKLIRDIIVFTFPSTHVLVTSAFLILNIALSVVSLLLLYKVLSKK